jgi:hypothetical protein
MPRAAAVSEADAVLALIADTELDDDELEELNFVQSFSLLENVIRERFTRPIESEPAAVAEVISYREGRLMEVARIDRGESYQVFDPANQKSLPLLKLKKTGKARLFFRDDTRGSVVLSGQTTPLNKLCSKENLAHKKQRIFGADLAEGDFAHVKLQGKGYLLRFVRAPVPPPRTFDMQVTKEDRAYMALATVAMVLVVVGIWLSAMLAPNELMAMEEEVEFAEVSLKEVELEPPEEVKEPEPEPEPPAETQAEAPPPPEPRKAPKRRRRKRARGGGAPAPPDPGAAAAASALQALASVGPSKKTDFSKAVSNIAAVRVPTGAS